MKNHSRKKVFLWLSPLILLHLRKFCSITLSARKGAAWNMLHFSMDIFQSFAREPYPIVSWKCRNLNLDSVCPLSVSVESKTWPISFTSSFQMAALEAFHQHICRFWHATRLPYSVCLSNLHITDPLKLTLRNEHMPNEAIVTFNKNNQCFSWGEIFFKIPISYIELIYIFWGKTWSISDISTDNKGSPRLENTLWT